MKYEIVIGLEIHAELSTKSKIYCSCKNQFSKDPNINCCPICTGMPGVLPVLNKKVVEYAVKAGLATNCEINHVSKQDRKNYFYPDLPKAYQTSQYDLPICKNGWISIFQNGKEKKVGITRIHIEEDAGKLVHDGAGTLVDYNRCGVPLIEIVTEPDIRSAQEARGFLEKLKSILEYTGVSDCKMQEGSLRCDVNVSIRPFGETEFGTRTEIKNLNSFKAVLQAAEYEASRQAEELNSGREIIQETRRWDDIKGMTYSMRSKEEAHDYRYFPEPDLVPIIIDSEWISELRENLPELPEARSRRYVSEYGLTEYDAALLTSSVKTAEYYDRCIKAGANPKLVCNWITGDISKMLNGKGLEPGEIPFSPEDMAKFISLIENGTISSTAGKKVMEEMFAGSGDPDKIIKEKGLVQISDTDMLLKIVLDVISSNPGSVTDYKSGKEKALGALVGQAMKATKGQGNPQVLNKLIREELDKK